MTTPGAPRQSTHRLGQADAIGWEPKRRFYLAYLAIVVVGMAAFWATSLGRELLATRVAVPVVLVVAVAAWVVLWRRPRSVAFVELAMYWFSYVAILGTLYVNLSLGETDTLQTGLFSFAVWAPVVVVWSFLAFGRRRGFLATCGFALATVATFVAAGLGGGPFPAWMAPHAAQLGIGGAVLLVMLYTLADVLERQVAARTSAEAAAEYALVDPLTGLANRRALALRFDQARALAARSSQLLAVHFVDVDDFKRVNDTHGHDEGDALLAAFARRLAGAVRASDTVARVGGDEFVVVAIIQDATQVWRLAQKLLETLGKPFRIGDQDVVLQASVGVSIYPHDGQDVETLLKRADAAMYQAKAHGKAQWATASRLDTPVRAAAPN